MCLLNDIQTCFLSLIGESGVAAPSMIVSTDGIELVNESPSSNNTTASITLLNGKTKPESSGIFAECYSDMLLESLSQNEL